MVHVNSAMVHIRQRVSIDLIDLRSMAYVTKITESIFLDIVQEHISEAGGSVWLQ